jgi:hypothetical protein
MQGNVVSTMEYGLFWTIVGLGLIAGNQRRNLSEVGLK